MENKVVVETKTNVEELKDYNWLSIEHSDGEIDFVEGIDKIVEAADLWGMTPAGVRAMLNALDRMAEYFADAMKEDLLDVWRIANCAHDHVTELIGEDEEEFESEEDNEIYDEEGNSIGIKGVSGPKCYI